MAKIVFIIPESSHLITQKVHPPLGVLYLAAVLRDKHEVEVLDLAGVTKLQRPLSSLPLALSMRNYLRSVYL
jgi:hypothetical protein